MNPALIWFWGRALRSLRRSAYCLIALSVALAASGCAQQPVAQAAAETKKAQPSPAQAVQPKGPKLPRVELTDELLYGLLLAEIALSRGDGETALAHLDAMEHPCRGFVKFRKLACRPCRNVTPPPPSSPGPFTATRCRATLASYPPRLLGVDEPRLIASGEVRVRISGQARTRPGRI